MKKTLVCLVVFTVLFLVANICVAQAQVTGLNGTWLKFTGSLKGMRFTNGPGSEELGRNDKDSIRLYGCVVDSPYFFDNQFFVQLYKSKRNAIRAGAAVFQKPDGTADNFAGWFNMNLMDEYNPATPNVYSTSISTPGQMTIRREKIKFKGFGGQAEKIGGGYTGYALYGVKNMSAKTVNENNVPLSKYISCPAGYVINVKNTDDGDHTGTITPPGPWVDVTTGYSQVFNIKVNAPGTYVYVYIDNELKYYYPDVYPADTIPPVTIDSDGENHSLWVHFD